MSYGNFIVKNLKRWAWEEKIVFFPRKAINLVGRG